ncbi:MAG: glutamate synthase subunit beta [Bacteroidota bacterium]
MGKAGGFLQYQRVSPTYRPVADRIHDFREFINLLSEEEVRRQGARCMSCGVPFCHWLGCPLHNDIPNWNDLVYHGQWREAYQQLEWTSTFPEIAARVCPALCEASCTLSVNISPVSIRQIELFIAERAFENGWVIPSPPLLETNKRITVIGSGPAGLAAAQRLRRLGHSVTVFEKADKVGGILRYGIPDFKLEKWVIDRRLLQMRGEGVHFETNVNVGEDISSKELQQSFEAIILTLGSGQPRDLRVPGCELEGVYQAMDYLTQSNMYVAGTKKQDEIIWVAGKNVVVIGGGDTGNDCVGTAIRQGAKTVQQFEILPKPREWDKPFNPDWPDWPKVLRNSSSHEEGCYRDWSVETKEFLGSGPRLEKGNFVRVDWIKDERGNEREMFEIPGSDFSVDVDFVFLAMGFVHVKHGKLIHDLEVALDERGNIKTDGKYATSVRGVFAAGDAMTGASLVARAMRHGREAAGACHEFLVQLN